MAIKTLLPKTDFNASNPFCISKVESDDLRIYFTCNNGFLYAFDLDGNLVWKKNLGSFPLYKPVTSNSDGPFSMFGLNNGKIYIKSYSSPGTNYPDFKIIDAASGNVLHDAPSYSSGTFSLEKFPTYLFTDQYLFNFSYYSAGALDKVTGSDPFIGSSYSGNGNYASWRNAQPIDVLSNNQIAIIDYDQKLAFFDITRNQFGQTSIDCSTIHGGVFSSDVLYGGFCNAAGRKFDFSAVKISTGNAAVIWKNSWTMEPTNVAQKLSKFIVSGDKIYLFVNFHIDNGICKVNPQVSGLFEAHSIIVLNAADGSILKQCQNVPGYGYWYNIIK